MEYANASWPPTFHWRWLFCKLKVYNPRIGMDALYKLILSVKPTLTSGQVEPVVPDRNVSTKMKCSSPHCRKSSEPIWPMSSSFSNFWVFRIFCNFILWIRLHRKTCWIPHVSTVDSGSSRKHARGLWHHSAGRWSSSHWILHCLKCWSHQSKWNVVPIASLLVKYFS